MPGGPKGWGKGERGEERKGEGEGLGNRGSRAPRQGVLRLESGAGENQPPKLFLKTVQIQLVFMLRARRRHWRLSLENTASWPRFGQGPGSNVHSFPEHRCRSPAGGDQKATCPSHKGVSLQAWGPLTLPPYPGAAAYGSSARCPLCVADRRGSNARLGLAWGGAVDPCSSSNNSSSSPSPRLQRWPHCSLVSCRVPL